MLNHNQLLSYIELDLTWVLQDGFHPSIRPSIHPSMVMEVLELIQTSPGWNMIPFKHNYQGTLNPRKTISIVLGHKTVS